jgi:catechol 2,3-dioxygenase-like lactoylglutathione lyase family enzyme
MHIQSSTISLTVVDVRASVRFFVEHLGYVEQMAADGFASLGHAGGGVDLVFLQRGIEILPENQRDQQASGVILAFVVDDLDGELARLEREGVVITLPLREEEWGERLFMFEDPNGVAVELVQWQAGSRERALRAE